MKIPAPSALLLALALLAAGCGGGGGGSDSGGSRDPDNNACDVLGLSTRIIGGSSCSGNSPVLRLIVSSSEGSFFCTGTLISPNKVLTAAHCVSDETYSTVASPRSVSVALADTTTTLAVAKRVIVTSQASRDLTNIATQAVANGEDLDSGTFNITRYIELYGLSDIAVIELDRSLSLPTAAIRTSSIPESGAILSIFGYGATNADAPAATTTLYSGEMELGYAGPKNLFAPYDGTGSDTCSGDSGGPLIEQNADGTYVIVGTTLGGSQRCAAGDIAIFTSTAGEGIASFLKAAAPDATYK